ncbi:MAG: UDP-3-O-acyl-N-acetylglucosamine deacetylase, partial [Pseudomonadota bacterium]
LQMICNERGVLNEEGLRFPNEFVRHKMLDAVGDLSLAGFAILGAFKSVCGGHRLNANVVRTLLADPTSYAIVSGVDAGMTAPTHDVVRPSIVADRAPTALAGE